MKNSILRAAPDGPPTGVSNPKNYGDGLRSHLGEERLLRFHIDPELIDNRIGFPDDVNPPTVEELKDIKALYIRFAHPWLRTDTMSRRQNPIEDMAQIIGEELPRLVLGLELVWKIIKLSDRSVQ